ncbi:hypothetical protein BDN67DRAFT_969810 [Paxillus ammoniavirescens]|nr:hypothetical protein BDN67DRAFT_969810 [Paxillus ammoniavirescens]
MTGAKWKMFVMACVHLNSIEPSSPSNLCIVTLPSPPSDTRTPSMSKTSTKPVDLTPKPVLTISGHRAPVNGIAYIMPREQRLVTCSRDKTVRIWNVEKF